MAARLVLVDGTALIYRAYFALPSNLSTKSGLHTNAIYGFSTMFSKLLGSRVPDYAAVVFDPPGGSFRSQTYSQYKAQRPKADDDLIEQMPWIDKVVEANNFPMLRVSGFEADDVIGTLSREARERGLEVHIISSDKDFAQLIDPQVKMHDTLRDVLYDAELVRKKWGVPPRLFVDFLALIGDKADNIPGVPGIGPKGAIALLEEFGSLAGILANLDKIVGRNRKLLEEFREQALLSQKLATIDCHVALPLTVEDLRYTSPRVAELNQLYRELEFYSLLNDGSKAKQAQEEGQTRCVAWDGAALPKSGVIGLQVVFRGPAVDGEVLGVAVSSAPGDAFFVEASRLDSAWKDWLADPLAHKVVHDLRPTLVALWKASLDLQGACDTRLASFIVDPSKLIPHDLSQLVKEYLQRTLAPPPQAELSLEYGCHRADLIAQVWPFLEDRLKQAGLWEEYLEKELPLTPALARMQQAGVKVEPEDLARLGQEFRERLQEIEHSVHALAGHEFNLGSTKQLGTVLFDELKLPVIKRTKTGYSTDAEVLERLAPKHSIAHQILEHRKLAKLINTYTDALGQAIHPRSGRIHPSYQQTLSATGRLISTDPDLQRTPIRTAEGVRIRQAFVAEPGHKLISADWSQVELRILAHFCADAQLVEAFRFDLDIHRRTASQLFGVSVEEVSAPQREVAKTVNFATIYGQGASALGQILDVPRKTAQEYIDNYFKAYAGVRRWLDDTIAAAHRDGYVTTLFGRRRFIPELSSRNPLERQAGERIAANTPIQGTAADLCKLAMLNIDRRLANCASRIILQIHDELVLESPLGEVEAVSEMVRHEMEHVWELNVPLKVNLGVGQSWADAH